MSPHQKVITILFEGHEKNWKLKTSEGNGFIIVVKSDCSHIFFNLL